MSTIKLVGVSVLALLALLLFIGANTTPKERTEKEKFENAAAECWKEYERKSLSPIDKLGVAKFCEGLDDRAKNL